ncbi:MAG TPA: elongation factor G [Firmicutes bacterium]|nr:elongation factor G [Bacillota bacterium]
MKSYTVDKIRNIVLVGHGGCGKTMLAEAMLYDTKAVDRFGQVDDGTSVMDHDPEEVKRKISINTSLAPVEFENHKINLLDTPGFFDFVGEVKAGVRVADAGLVVVCAASGVEVGTEKVWNYLDERDLPRIVFINKMDRENANFYQVYDALKGKFGSRLIPVAIPIGAAESFNGYVDVITGKAYIDGKEAEVPAELKDQVEEYYHLLLEAAAEADDDLLTKYLEGEDLTKEEVLSGFRKGTMAKQIIPVICGSAVKRIGIDNLMKKAVEVLPSPADSQPELATNPQSKEETQLQADANGPVAALVFKTMADPFVGKLTLFRVYSGKVNSDSSLWNATRNQEERIGQLFLVKGKTQIPVPALETGDIGAVAKLQVTNTNDTLCAKATPFLLAGAEFPNPKLTMAVVAKAKGDEEKISSGLNRLVDEDPTIKVEKDTTTKEQLLSGIGDLHLEVIVSKLQKKFGVQVELKDPKVPYKETIKGTVKVEGKHKKQSGGRGQYGHVWLELEPLPSGGGFEFVDKIFGGAVPRQFIPAVEKGIRETMEEGVLAGYPVVDVRATLYDGSYHSVDSSEMAFKIAASMAFKKGFMDSNPVLLEPIFNVTVTVPEEYMGDIIGDLNKKRGRILGMDPHNGLQVIKAQVPLSEMFKYAIDLRSITQGRGEFEMEFDHFEEVPANQAESIIAAAKENAE